MHLERQKHLPHLSCNGGGLFVGDKRYENIVGASFGKRYKGAEKERQFLPLPGTFLKLSK